MGSFAILLQYTVLSHKLDHELLGAEGVCDILDGVTEAVSVVVGGIDAPLSASAGVRVVLDPVSHRVLLAIAQSHLHPQCGLALSICTSPHALWRNSLFILFSLLQGIQFQWLWDKAETIDLKQLQ